MNLLYFQLSIICALFAWMLDYGLGQPGRDEFNIKSLLFAYTLFIAKIRLKKVGLYYELENQKNEAQRKVSSVSERLTIENQFKKIILDQAKDYFIYEYAIGMCPICTHFWIALFYFVIVNIFYYSVNIITFTLYFLLSHLFIRLLNKL